MENNSLVLIGGVVGAIVILATVYVMGGFGSKPKQNDNSKQNSTKVEEKKTVANEKEKYPAGKLNIYFGSQTGTAEGFARTLMEEGKTRGFDAKMADLEDFSPEAMADGRLGIFLMATYGEGEPTDNAAQFYKWLKNENQEIASAFLERFSFCVFGLGNRQYEHFNKMGKSVNSLLEKIGANRIFDLGEGDDDGSLEEDFEAWKSKMWASLISQYHPRLATSPFSPLDNYPRYHPDAASSQVEGEDEQKKKVELLFETEPSAPGPCTISSSQMNSSTKFFFNATEAGISVNRELRSGVNVGSTRHIEVAIAGTSLRYETADNLAVLAVNDASVVARFASSLGLPLDDTFAIKPVAGSSGFKYPFPTPCTIREALTRFLDIQGKPRLGLLAQLVPYVTDEGQKLWLTTQLSKENRHAFGQYIEEQGRSLVELFSKELSSAKIPLADLLHLVPTLQPRYYTISSSSSCHPDSIHITVSVTEANLPDGRLFRGVCSSYLQVASSCHVFVRPSSFRLPRSLATPVIMIGPGTGIAPMRALVQEREHQYQTSLKTKPTTTRGENVLYFGCKRAAEDYIYRDELEQALKDGALSQLHLAFSRDQKEKVYVQHLLKNPDNATALVSSLDSGAYVFVCGATAMGTDVLEAIVDIIADKKSITRDAAQQFVKNLQTKGRYVQELWTA